jgi:hypothetical protein
MDREIVTWCSDPVASATKTRAFSKLVGIENEAHGICFYTDLFLAMDSARLCKSVLALLHSALLLLFQSIFLLT